MERTEDMPELVYLGLWGIQSRAVALAWMLGALAVGLVSLVATFRYPTAQYGAYLLLAVPWYWYAIRWVDKNSAWEQTES